MNVDSRYSTSYHKLMILLLIFGAQYLVTSLIYINKLPPYERPNIQIFSPNVIPTRHTFDIHIYQLSYCVTTQYLAD